MSNTENSPPEPNARVAQLEQALARQTQRARAIQQIAAALGSTLELEPLVALIMGEVTALMGAERSTLFLLDDATGELWSKYAQGSTSVEIRLRKGEGIAGHVAITGQTVNVPDAYADARFQPEWDRRTGFRTRSILCEPVRNKRGEVLGVVQVLNKSAGPFDADEEALLSALAGQVAVSIENAKLYQGMVARNAELASAHQQLER